MFQRVRKTFFFMILIVLLSGCSSEPEVKVATETKTETTTASSKIYVYICGQVKRPGVYTFSSGDRIVSAVKADRKSVV